LYVILTKFSDNQTGISKISYDKLRAYSNLSKDKLSRTIHILSDLGVIYYKKGFGYGDSSMSNQYIFPYERWNLPTDKEKWDDYIMHPDSYKLGEKSEYSKQYKNKSKNNNPSQPTTANSRPNVVINKELLTKGEQ